MAERILVTGATGTVGNEVIKQLSGDGIDINIKAGVHSAQNANRIQQNKKLETVQIDYNKPDTLRLALNNVDKIFFVTPVQSDMVQLSFNLLREINDTGKNIKHIVKLSNMGSDVEPQLTVVRLHRQIEKMIEESGIPFTLLRPNFFMQNFVTYHLQTIREQGIFYQFMVDRPVSMVDVRDVAAVAVQALTSNYNGKHVAKKYTITGPEAISYEEAVNILSEQIGKKISYVSILEEAARERMKAVVKDEWLIDSIMELYSDAKMEYVSKVTSVIEEITGSKPKTFARFAKDYSEAFR